MNETILFTGTDHTDRSWVVTTWPHDGQLIVRFVCWHATGKGKALGQTAAWSPADGWDMQRWFPRCPAPVPEAILKMVERRLTELVRQQQAQLQQEGGAVADPIRDAAERLLQELELHAPLHLERAKSDLRAALAAQPPADTPLDLDALLSPKGAYEPGIGHEDGAQLLTDRHGGNPQWWAPVYGCDTLENLLDRIRTRILPHLRPPIAGIDVPGGDGDYGGLSVGRAPGAPLQDLARRNSPPVGGPPAQPTTAG